MSLRENTDTRSVPSPSSATVSRGTIRPRIEGNDRTSVGTTRPARELAIRECDGIHVALLWHPGENALTVSVEDERIGDRFSLAVAPDRALDAFYHPYAYAA